MLADFDFGLAHARLGNGVEEAGEQISEGGHRRSPYLAMQILPLHRDRSRSAGMTHLHAAQDRRKELLIREIFALRGGRISGSF
jgi:hypothetical protein